jgi:hypothetical protein
MRQSLRWAALFSPTSGSRDVVETREGISRGACERLNLHRAASAGPAASFNLGLSDSNYSSANAIGVFWGGHFGTQDGMHFEISKLA